MSEAFSKILSELSLKAEKVSKKLTDSEKITGVPTILHPQVWKTKEEAKKAQEDPEFREKTEILKQFERQISS